MTKPNSGQRCSSEAIVFLPGMMCDARLFAPQINAFSAHHPVMVMPLIGRCSIEKLVEDILAHAPPRFALAGLSMGGIVAMELMRLAPQRVTRLALLDTNPMADTKERIAQRERQIQQVKAGQLREIMRDEMKPNYLANGPNKSEILQLCMDMAETLSEQVFIQQSRALQTRRDQCDTLAQVTVPTLIMCGESDSLCPPEKHRMMHELVSGSRFKIVPDAGHLPTLEQAQRTNEEIKQWLTM